MNTTPTTTTSTDSGGDRPRMTWDGDAPPLDRCTPAARAIIEGDTRTRGHWGSDTLRRPTPGDERPGTIWGGAGGNGRLWRNEHGVIGITDGPNPASWAAMNGPVTPKGCREILHKMAATMGLRITGIEEVDTDGDD